MSKLLNRWRQWINWGCTCYTQKTSHKRVCVLHRPVAPLVIVLICVTISIPNRLWWKMQRTILWSRLYVAAIVVCWPRWSTAPSSVRMRRWWPIVCDHVLGESDVRAPARFKRNWTCAEMLQHIKYCLEPQVLHPTLPVCIYCHS